MNLAVEQLPIDELVPDPANPRRIGEAELDALCRSVQEFGAVAPLIAQRTSRRVIDGHQRLLAARRLGHDTVPVVFVDLNDARAHLLNLALNKIRGEWDEALLARLLADLEAEAADVSLSGFGEDEVRQLLRTLETRERRHQAETFDVAAAIEQAQTGKAKTQPGDLWQLGPHRLLCADATDAGAVARLLDGGRGGDGISGPSLQRCPRRSRWTATRAAQASHRQRCAPA